jgi:N-acetylmuramoyl-L-alanine amidase
MKRIVTTVLTTASLLALVATAQANTVPPLVKDAIAIRPTALRAGRDLDYAATATLTWGEAVTYLDGAETWIKVQKANGQSGWVDAADLSLRDHGVEYGQSANYVVDRNDWEIRYLRARDITATAAPLLSGPSAGSGIKGIMRKGERIKLLWLPTSEYVPVLLGNGVTGWLSRYQLTMPPYQTPTESMQVTESSPGVVRVVLTGQSTMSYVSATADTLRFALPNQEMRAASLQVRENGVMSMGMEATGASVQFAHPFQFQVVEQSATKTVVEIRSSVQGVSLSTDGLGDTYRIYTTGTPEPTAERVNGNVTITIPGARLNPNATSPASLTWTSSSSGVVGQIRSSHTFAMKRGDGYIDLVIYAPGLAGKTIVLDPGHGGIESGAVGPTGVKEKSVNLATALKLKTLLEGAGAIVRMTRSADTRCASPAELAQLSPADQLRYDLNCRSIVANNAKADAFISIHANANGDRSVAGTTTYWAPSNFNVDQSWLLATYVQQELVKTVGRRNLGIKNDWFSVTRYTDAPAILAEIAFLSNPDEEWLLNQPAAQQQVAQALFTGLSRFFQ